MSQPNPYAAPTAASTASDPAAIEKARRTNLINRRTVALLVEMFVYVLTLGAPLSVLAERVITVSPFVSGAVAWLPFYLARDVVGPASFAKRWVGLRIETTAPTGGVASAGARVLRNLVLVVQVSAIVEFLVAYYGNSEMQRLGDMMASTRVVDGDPARYGRSSYSWQLLAAFVGLALVAVVLRRLHEFWASVL